MYIRMSPSIPFCVAWKRENPWHRFVRNMCPDSLSVWAFLSSTTCRAYCAKGSFRWSWSLSWQLQCVTLLQSMNIWLYLVFFCLPDTGDVRFICLERKPASPSSTDASLSTSRQSSSLSASCSPFSSQTIARKRVIYAHSDILIRRSEYFAGMLSSSFSENQIMTNEERKVYTVVVEEADFETIYWLLKFCYTNWLIFSEDDDPRLAMDGVGIGWSAKWLHTRGGEWDWQIFQKDDSTIDDTRSVTSGDSLSSPVDTGGLSPNLDALPSKSTTSTTPISGSSSGSQNLPTSLRAASIPSARPGVLSSRRTTSATRTTSNTPSSSRTKSVSILPVTPIGLPLSTCPGHPISPSSERRHPLSQVSVPDPHPHPTPPPRPASALSVYQIAHRYAMPNLATLALDHIMSTITPQSSFALLLASSVWEGLHSLVEVGF